MAGLFDAMWRLPEVLVPLEPVIVVVYVVLCVGFVWWALR